MLESLTAMSIALLLISLAGCFLTGGCVVSVLGGRRNSNLAGSCVLLTAAMLTLAFVFSAGKPTDFSLPAPVYLGIAPVSFHFDALAGIFLVLLLVVSSAAAIFSPGYLRHSFGEAGSKAYWPALFLFVLGMGATVLAANALTFIVYWEMMSLSSAVLVALDSKNTKTARAALIYLGATRIATALLASGFIWAHKLTGSWAFASWHLNSTALIGPALLVLLGLAIKAGLWPFHVWLPYAHPSAPAPVSALMSGVMIKVAIYAMIRFFCWEGGGSQTLAWVLGSLGIVSAVWGILFAMAQTDLKRILAYSSVENIGLVALALSICMYCRATAMSHIATMALVAAIFHCLNHGAIKSLLFLGAGAIDCQAHGRDLTRLGGLAKAMPQTSLLFIIGGASICALPPLNGFASKWLIYQSLFNLAVSSRSQIDIGLAIACMGTLGLVSGLALACFTRAIGVALLGRARTRAAANAQECGSAMIAAQVLLSTTCVAMGLGSPWISRSIERLVQSGSTYALPVVPTGALGVFLGLSTILIFRLAFARQPKRTYMTWECGNGPLTARMQVTADSFAQPVEALFKPVLQYELHSEISGRDRRHFPEQVKTEAAISSLLESQIYGPAVNSIRWLSSHLSRLQAGSIHLYLLYVLVTLITLLLVGSRI
jgi:hydrogenase-4 component B